MIPSTRNTRPALFSLLSMAAATAMLSGCSDPAPESPTAAATPQNAFFEALTARCGKAYTGQLVSDDAADDDFVDAGMVMHVSECSEDRIAVPFHVQIGEEWDRSRTWLITRTENGLRLKHDHRHEDGESDAVTMYGGDTAPGVEGAGTARTQIFPVDAESIALFQAEGLDVSITNVWRVEIDPAGATNGRFAYQLQRTVEGGAPEPRNFRVEFDLTEEVEAPPAAWGWE